MAIPEPTTIREQIACSYANLARAHAALETGSEKYSRVHHIVRNRLYHGLVSGKMSMRTIFDDERIKMTMPQACYYCGSRSHLAVDHLIPRIRGGSDDSDNLVWACRACNSSKQGKDLMAWTSAKGVFPSVLLLRRYLKIVAKYCNENSYMEIRLEDASDLALPFDARLLPTRFPPLQKLKLWVHPDETE